MHARQAIRTRYHGPAGFKGARISAQCEAGRIYIGYDHSLNIEQNHKAACDAMMAKLECVKPRQAGVFGSDFYWVEVTV